MYLFYEQLSKHKFLEVQLDRFEEWSYFKFNFELTRKQDHAGLHFHLELFGFSVIVAIYDHRHWNYDKNEWETE